MKPAVSYIIGMKIHRTLSQALTVTFLAAAALSAPAKAAETRSVIELFTSQGCSSCPPADALLGELAKDPSTIALTFPVDYWDYIGWKDTLASPVCTARQKAYSAARGDGQVYTPQAVIDGVMHAVGSDSAEIKNAVQTAASRQNILNVKLGLTTNGGNLHVNVPAAGSDGLKSAGLWLLRVAHKRSVAIGRGENSGHSVTYTNVVRGMVKLGDWTGEAKGFDVKEPLPDADSDGYVVLLQAAPNGRPGNILGAVKSAGL